MNGFGGFFDPRKFKRKQILLPLSVAAVGWSMVNDDYTGRLTMKEMIFLHDHLFLSSSVRVVQREQQRTTTTNQTQSSSRARS